MRGEEGFTLIELLVVVAMIGILAVIAIYQFAGYKNQAFCASVESDVKNTVTAEEAFYAANQAYGATPIKTSQGGVANSITPGLNTAGTGTVKGSSAACGAGKTFTFDQATGQYAW